MATIIIGHPYIIVPFQYIFCLYIIKNCIMILNNNFSFIFRKIVLFYFSNARVSNKNTCFLIVCNLVICYRYVIITKKKNAITLIILNLVILDILNSSQTYYTIKILIDLVVLDNEFLTKNAEYSLASCIRYCVSKYDIVYVVWTLNHQITF